MRDNPMGPDQRWVEVAPTRAATGITLVTWFPSLVLQTGDVDADVDRLRAAGVTVDDAQDAPWGRFATLDDPDGNGIVLAGPPPAGA